MGATLHRTAYYMLQHKDFTKAALAEASIRKYADVDLFVCNPSIPHESVADFRKALSDIRDGAARVTILAAEHCFAWLPAKFPRNPYYKAKNALMPSQRLLKWKPYPGIKAFHMTEDLADRLVDFHLEHTLYPSGPFDGQYLDCYGHYVPGRFHAAMLAAGISPEAFDCQLAKGLLFYTALLRRRAPGYPVIGNAMHPFRDPSMNGMSMEEVGRKRSMEDGVRWFMNHRQDLPGGGNQRPADRKIYVAWVHDFVQADTVLTLTSFAGSGTDEVYYGRMGVEFMQ
jgi:hypothetical protein